MIRLHAGEKIWDVVTSGLFDARSDEPRDTNRLSLSPSFLPCFVHEAECKYNHRVVLIEDQRIGIGLIVRHWKHARACAYCILVLVLVLVLDVRTRREFMRWRWHMAGGICCLCSRFW